MRGPVAPPQVPLAVSRAEVFEDLVQDSVERLERRWPQLADIDFVVLEVPRLEPAARRGLGRRGGAAGRHDRGARGPARTASSSTGGRSRSAPRDRDERAPLVHEVVVEQVAELLGLTPETVDPRYGQD